MSPADLATIERAVGVACHESVLDDDVGDALIERLRADAQALADVRTLDDWSRKQRGHGHETMQIAGGLFLTRLLDAFSLSPTTEDFEGATPDEARAKAAAWARKQKGERQ